MAQNPRDYPDTDANISLSEPYRRQLLKTLALTPFGSLLACSAPSDAASSTLSVKQFGAIGDGRSHPISEWIPSRYPDFAALKRDYPDARQPTDEIDFVAINQAVRVAGARGIALHFPPGTYLAWIYIRQDNVSLIGSGADVCRIRLPAGALHRLLPERGRKALTGTPCVIEAGSIGDGNFARPFRGLQLSGFTLDGNRSATRQANNAREDIFGWGLAFTNFSDVRYEDLIAENCHAGGIGTFINSDRHVGTAIIRNCGEALNHPGFDVNSSHDGKWNITVSTCPYGVRLLDNIWNCRVVATIDNAELSGLVCNNQAVNESYLNDVQATIKGGCKNSGAQIGDGWSRSTFRLDIDDVRGVGVNSIGPVAGSRGETRNNFFVKTARCGAQSVIVDGNASVWDIQSSEDGTQSPAGSLFAIDVRGRANTLSIAIDGSQTKRLRAIALRTTSGSNQLRYSLKGKFIEIIKDTGENNIMRSIGVS